MHGNYQQLVLDPDVDVIYVATPNSLHAEHTRLALAHRKAVLCEKPFTVNAAEARTVVAEARASRVFCMEAMWMRFVPAFKEIEQTLASGAIGEVTGVYAQIGFANVPDPANRLFDPSYGGGALLDLGVYPLSLASRFLGQPDRVVSHAVLGRTGVDEQVGTVLGYPGGKMAVLSASITSRVANNAAIIGTTGRVEISAPLYRPHRFTVIRSEPARHFPGSPGRGGLRAVARRSALLRWLDQRYGEVLRPAGGSQQRTVRALIKGNGYNYEAAEVVRCLNEGKTESEIMPLDESVQIMETVDAVRASWQS